MFLPIFFYYGFAKNFDKLFIGETTITLFEKYERGNENGDETVCRIHVLKKATGERISRFYVGHKGSILGQRGDTMAYMYNDDVILFDCKNQTIIKEINKDDLPVKFDELKDGIESIATNQNYSTPVEPIVIITGKNGKTYYLDPFSKQHKLSLKKEFIPLKKLTIKNYTIELPKTVYSGNTILTTRSTGDQFNEKIEVTTFGKKYISWIDTNSYLDPFFLALDTTHRYFTFGYYQTTDRNEFILVTRNFDGKLKWSKKSQELYTKDRYNKHASTVCETEGKTMYLNDGGYMLAINSESGKIIWKSRL